MRTLVLLLCFLMWGGLSWFRLHKEQEHRVESRSSKQIVGTRWDPRGFEVLDRIRRNRESESFKDRLRRGSSLGFVWPGLKSLQVSWSWLELLQGLHHEASYEGDFSWMFSKLHTVIRNTPPSELSFITGLAPFFMVIGKDHIGANILMQEMLNRGRDQFNPWFWSGWHALENLYDAKMASSMFAVAATFQSAPTYLKFLSYRLMRGYRMNDEELFALLEKDMPKDVIERYRSHKKESRQSSD